MTQVPFERRYLSSKASDAPRRNGEFAMQDTKRHAEAAALRDGEALEVPGLGHRGRAGELALGERAVTLAIERALECAQVGEAEDQAHVPALLGRGVSGQADREIEQLRQTAEGR